MNPTTKTDSDPTVTQNALKTPPVAKLLLSQQGADPSAKQPKCGISMNQCKVRGDIQYQVRFPDPLTGKPVRKFFPTSEKATNFALELQGETLTNRKKLTMLETPEQDLLMAIYNRAQERRVALPAILTWVDHAEAAVTASPALETAITELLDNMETKGLKTKYVGSVRQVLNNFKKGLEDLPVNRVTLDIVEAFLKQYSNRNRSSLRSRLSLLFKYSIRKGYINRNPCERLENVKVAYVPPHILTVDEMRKALKYLLKHPRPLAWFVVSCLAGLRPSEAERLTWDNIDFEEKCIRVEVTKTSHRRVVYPMRMVFDWLKAAQQKKSQLPLCNGTLRRDIRDLRKAVGWTEWKQDVTRHTAASYWLAQIESASGVAEQLGNSERMLKRHYKALVTRKEAEAFWALTPKAVLTE